VGEISFSVYDDNGCSLIGYCLLFRKEKLTRYGWLFVGFVYFFT